MFDSRKYYVKETDTALPSELGRENIILKLEGMKEIADYYKEKYGVAIIPFNSIMTSAPDKIANLIYQARENAPDHGISRVGFIFNNIKAGNYGHAMPMVYEKNDDKESLFFLDTGQYLGDVSYHDYDCDFIRMPSFSNDTPLDSLPGTSRHAYVLVDDNVFYIDKDKNEITEPLVYDNLFSDERDLDTDKLDRVNKLAKNLNFAPLNEGCSYTKLNEGIIVALEQITEDKTNCRGRDAMKFRQELKRLVPDLDLYSHIGRRQIDMSSCTTDAMIMLRDGLRLTAPLTEIAESKQVNQVGELSLFHMPEELLKTAQIGSYPEKSKADLGKPVHVKHIKDQDGKRTGEEVSITLGSFRDKYDVTVRTPRGQKKVGSYTVHKGELFSEIIKKRWEEKQNMNAISDDKNASKDTAHIMQKLSVSSGVNPANKVLKESQQSPSSPMITEAMQTHEPPTIPNTEPTPPKLKNDTSTSDEPENVRRGPKTK